jgi:predicted Zn-dependent protease
MPSPCPSAALATTRLIAALFALLLLTPSVARGDAGSFTWPGSGERTIPIEVDNLGPRWQKPLTKAILSWNRSLQINLVIGAAGTCATVNEGIELCGEHAGATRSWIGLAGIWTCAEPVGCDDAIDFANIEVNLDKSWSPAKRVFVLCHELGHALGLEHRAVGEGATVASCMTPTFSQSRSPYLADAQDLADLTTMYAP